MSNETTIPLKRITVELSTPVLWFDKNITKVVLKEPTAADFFRIGEPEVFVASGNGGSFVDVPEAMYAYLDKRLEVENGSTFLSVLGLRDGRAIKKALFSFFRVQAEAAPA